MKTLSLVLLISMIHWAPRSPSAAVNLGPVTSEGTEVVYFAGRTQEELRPIFDSVPDGEPRTFHLSRDIADNRTYLTVRG